MKKLLLTLAFLLSFSCFVTVPTHACEDCDGAHVTVFALEDETASPLATNCVCGGTMVTKTLDSYYMNETYRQCTHGKTTRDYIYDKYVTTALVCQDCGLTTNTKTTVSKYISCGVRKPTRD